LEKTEKGSLFGVGGGGKTGSEKTRSINTSAKRGWNRGDMGKLPWERRWV